MGNAIGLLTLVMSALKEGCRVPRERDRERERERREREKQREGRREAEGRDRHTVW